MKYITKNSFSLSWSVLIVAVVFLSFLLFGPRFAIFVGAETLVDRREDLKVCSDDGTGCSSCKIQTIEELQKELSFVDILKASVKTAGEDNPSLVMELRVEGSVPTSPGSFTAYSFALDLDGDPATGFRANSEPIGVFPDLGLDLWVGLSFYRGRGESFVFLGPNNIKETRNTPGIVKHSVDGDGKSIVFTVPVGRIERKLTFAYLHRKPEFELKLDRTRWVAFSSRATVHYPEENPVCDFLPDKYYKESPDGCPLKPIL
jgi:hypothetical protein